MLPIYPAMNFVSDVSEAHMRSGWELRKLPDNFLDGVKDEKHQQTTAEKNLGEISMSETKDLMTAALSLLEVVDPVGNMQNLMIGLSTIKNPLHTCLFLFVASFTILYLEIAIPLWFIGFAIYI